MNCLTFAVTFAQVRCMVCWDRGHMWAAGFFVAALSFVQPSEAQLAPVGAEFEVTTRTADSQNIPDIAAANDGFVVVWFNRMPTAGVFGQRYADDGTRRGSEFQINTYTTGNQLFPSVAGSPGGEFVAVWQGVGAGGGGVYTRRYDSSGTAQGTELQVTTDAFTPRVANDANGNFVVAWYGGNDGGPPAPGGALGVFARRYDSTSTPRGTAFLVNTYTTNPQRFPAVAMTGDGAFTVVWQSDQDGSNDGIFGQRYTSDGATTGTEFRVNSYTSGFQAHPAVAADDDGSFVVVWQSADQDGSSYGVFGQRFDGAGAPIGSEFQANTQTAFDQSLPDVGMDGGGRFLVTWGSIIQDESGGEVFAQEFDASGDRVGTEFRVNSTTAGGQDRPAVSATGDGTFVVAWDSGADGVFAQRFAQQGTATIPPSPTPTPTTMGSCPGDCDANDTVLVNEIIRCVNILLEQAGIDTCPVCDRNGSNSVTVDELVQSVNALLRGCPS